MDTDIWKIRLYLPMKITMKPKIFEKNSIFNGGAENHYVILCRGWTRCSTSHHTLDSLKTGYFHFSQSHFEVDTDLKMWSRYRYRNQNTSCTTGVWVPRSVEHSGGALCWPLLLLVLLLIVAVCGALELTDGVTQASDLGLLLVQHRDEARVEFLLRRLLVFDVLPQSAKSQRTLSHTRISPQPCLLPRCHTQTCLHTHTYTFRNTHK